MREIKFRTWDGEKMHDNCVVADGKALRRSYFASDLFSDFPKIAILMQYTGLKDANGVEIYEGDIVRHTIYELPNNESSAKYFRVGVVEYSAEEMAFTTDNNPYVSDQEQGIYPERMKVIGNIYQNPELLEDK